MLNKLENCVVCIIQNVFASFLLIKLEYKYHTETCV